MYHVTHNLRQSGQTLIETVVAIFVLVTALTTGLGLAVFALSTVNTSNNEVIASNLAREGVEVVRMMRDTNWLAADVASGNTYSLKICDDISGSLCYPNVYIGPTYNIPSGDVRVSFNNTNNTWSIAANTNYNLYKQSDGSYTDSVSGISYFARKIVITRNTSEPFTAQNPELIVQSIVGWRGKHCTWSGQDPAVASANCRVTVEDHLTNWKDYQ